MDPAAVVAEFLQAKQEHVNARQVDLRMEQDVQSATARVAADLHALHLHEERNAERTEEEPQPPPVADFLVEYHRNIGCYHCYLFVGDAAYDRIDASALRVHVVFPHVRLLLHGSSNGADDTLWWATEIERNVDEASCVVEVKGDHVYVRLPVKDGDKDAAGDGFSSFSQIVAKELDKAQYAELTCRSCDSVLMAASQIDKVLPLPSANWTDMFDFWGAGIGAFEHLPRDDIFAHARRVYVGEAHILLHEQETAAVALEDADDDAAPVGEGKQEPGRRDTAEDDEKATNDASWRPLRCSRCKVAVGMRHVENRETIRLEKHRISSSPLAAAAAVGSRSGAKEDIFARYTVDSVVSTKLLEFADSDGVFRFSLRASAAAAAPPPSLQLQLLSWETMIQVKSSAPEFRRVLKVLYSEESTPPVAPASQELLVASAVCEAVAQRLRESSALLPKTLRTFNKMSVGYLYA